MAYLYGDSSESELEINFIEFLKGALDFSVSVLMAEDRVRRARQSGDSRQTAAESELEQLQNLGLSVARALNQTSTAHDPNSAAAACATGIRLAATGAVTKAAEQIKSQLAEDMRKLGGLVQQERGTNLRALEALLRTHELPGTMRQVNLQLSGQKYKARLLGRCELDLEWILELQIGDGGLFNAPLRVDRLVPNLEVRVPEKSGLVRKSMKLRPQKLGNHFIVEAVRNGSNASVKLRAAADINEVGYDMVISSKPPRVRLARVGKNNEVGQPFEPLEEDCVRLEELYVAMTRAATELENKPGVLVEARLDGQSLISHDDPALLVHRLVERIAPTVREIARHSLSQDELVLKRVLGDNRREEIFASKRELLQKIEPVPIELRGVFAPLGLGPNGAPPLPGLPPGNGGGGRSRFSGEASSMTRLATTQNGGSASMKNHLADIAPPASGFPAGDEEEVTNISTLTKDGSSPGVVVSGSTTVSAPTDRTIDIILED